MRRWPTILTQVVDAMFRQCHDLSLSGQDASVVEGKQIIEKISALKYELTHDRALVPLGVQANTNALGSSFAPSTALYDSVITSSSPTWFHSDWLFTECYLYRRLRCFFESSTHWKFYDPFSTTKLDTFAASYKGIHACAAWMEELLAKSPTFVAYNPSTFILFKELVYSSLWGNATDLSLFTNMDFAELQKLQKTSADELALKEDRIIVNQVQKIWECMRTMRKGRVDIVLDNAGFELMTDLLLADFMLTLRGPIPRSKDVQASMVEQRIGEVHKRIGEASKSVPPMLLAVSKLQPPSIVMAAYEKTGQRHFGENYVQELVEKASVLPFDIAWHFIGGLQSNKAKLLAAIPNLYAVESIDSEKLAMGLEKALSRPENAGRRSAPLIAYVQVNTSGEDGKSGLPMMGPWSPNTPRPALLSTVEQIMLSCPHLRFAGLMTIGALANSQASNKLYNPDFEALVTSRKYLMEALRVDTDFHAKLEAVTWWSPTGNVKNVYKNILDGSEFLRLSMGMSADLEAAIHYGTDEVRIGSDCFGKRTTNADAAKVREEEIRCFVEQPLVDEVVFHTKNMPWFVSVCWFMFVTNTGYMCTRR